MPDVLSVLYLQPEHHLGSFFVFARFDFGRVAFRARNFTKRSQNFKIFKAGWFLKTSFFFFFSKIKILLNFTSRRRRRMTV